MDINHFKDREKQIKKNHKQRIELKKEVQSILKTKNYNGSFKYAKKEDKNSLVYQLQKKDFKNLSVEPLENFPVSMGIFLSMC